MVEPTFCIICRSEIPEDRASRKSNTCGKEHQRELVKRRRARVDARRCRLCHRPSTEEERKDYQRWRRSQPEYKLKGRGRPKKDPEPIAVTWPETGKAI